MRPPPRVAGTVREGRTAGHFVPTDYDVDDSLISYDESDTEPSSYPRPILKSTLSEVHLNTSTIDSETRRTWQNPSQYPSQNSSQNSSFFLSDLPKSKFYLRSIADGRGSNTAESTEVSESSESSTGGSTRDQVNSRENLREPVPFREGNIRIQYGMAPGSMPAGFPSVLLSSQSGNSSNSGYSGSFSSPVLSSHASFSSPGHYTSPTHHSTPTYFTTPGHYSIPGSFSGSTTGSTQNTTNVSQNTTIVSPPSPVSSPRNWVDDSRKIPSEGIKDKIKKPKKLLNKLIKKKKREKE